MSRERDLILVTVGTQIPFDRLVLAVETWRSDNLDVEIVAQVGKNGHLISGAECSETYSKEELDALVRRADLVVSHAGMGSIITARTLNVPILVMPRRYELGEHRNDHQMATAKAMQELCGVHVAWNESELLGTLDRKLELQGPGASSPHASKTLIQAVRSVIEE